MQQGCYELTKVTPPRPQTGCMVGVAENDRHAAVELVKGFAFFVEPEMPNLDEFANRLADRHIAHGNLYVWKDNDACVAVAAQVRDTPNGASISLVYTPEEHRGRGYASNLVAELSQHLLDQGKQLCNLFTDLSNRTSNGIYQRIGYKEIGRCSVYTLGPTEGEE